MPRPLRIHVPGAMYHVTLRGNHQQDINDRSAESPFTASNSNDRRILGSDEFAERLLGAQWRPRSRKTLDELIDEACGRYSITLAQLTSPSRRKELVAARAWVVHQALDGRVASIAAVARRFNRDESSLRHALNSHFPRV